MIARAVNEFHAKTVEHHRLFKLNYRAAAGSNRHDGTNDPSERNPESEYHTREFDRP
jgi:hypothetical protein